MYSRISIIILFYFLNLNLFNFLLFSVISVNKIPSVGLPGQMKILPMRHITIGVQMTCQSRLDFLKDRFAGHRISLSALRTKPQLPEEPILYPFNFSVQRHCRPTKCVGRITRKKKKKQEKSKFQKFFSWLDVKWTKKGPNRNSFNNDFH